MTTATIQMAQRGAGPIPRGTCLGRLDPTCPANQHGTYSAYRIGCRCPHAREAVRIYQKRVREHRNPSRFIPAAGTRRRLQALSAIGWRWRDMAPHLGSTWQNVQNIATTNSDRPVLLTTAARVKALYEHLANTTGPSSLTRHRAAAKGWAPPIAWDDDTIDDPNAKPDLGEDSADLIDPIAIDRALAGEHVNLTDAEREEAFRVGFGRGLTAYAIGHALHLSSFTYKAIARRVRAEQAA